MSYTEQCDSIGTLEVGIMEERTKPETEPDLEGTTQQANDWAELVQNIRAGDANAMEKLYQVFARGIRLYLCRQLGLQDVDDKVHDTFLIVVQAIKNGELREPDRLMGFVRTIARRLVAGHIDQMVHRRRDNVPVESGIAISDDAATPEQDVLGREKVDIMFEVLRDMSGRDRDILTRFYLYEESQETISREMDLTPTQFRLLKSRAKARFAELGKKKLDNNNSVRTSPRLQH